MECNKDEAMRAKDIAVRKFTERDFAGAKKFALKAQTLYPGLEGISQMLTTLEVFISAESKVHGEMDMYGILGVDPLADDETIKKHYRKLALLLHPDKNKSIGADGAFQLVSQAFSFLSDKAKRSAYNSRRNVISQQKVPQSRASAGPAGSRQFQKFPTQGPPSSGRTVGQKIPTKGGVSGSSPTVEPTFRAPGSSAPQQKVNGYQKNPSSTSSHGRSQKSSTQRASAAQKVFKKDDTFWTVCSRCKMQYEYMRVYLNQVLKCPHCQVGFVASEIPPPSNLSPVHRQQQHQKSSWSSGPDTSGLGNSFSNAGARWSPLFGTTANNNNNSSNNTRAHPGSAPAQAAGVSQHVNGGVKRQREEVPADARWERSDGAGFVKKRKEDDSLGTDSRGTIQSQSGVNFFPGFGLKFHITRELSLVELRKMLTDKALVEIKNKLKEWRSSSEAINAAKEKEKVKGKERQKAKLAKDVAIEEVESHRESSDSRKESEPKKLTLSTSASYTEQEAPAAEVATMIVPDSDFHDFDSDRSESCFGENQVWAAYDNNDGMPRFYAMIHEVISLDPFKIRISWLNSKSSSEFGASEWISRGFNKTCGDFRVGKHEKNGSLNSFSHKVKWAKGPRGVIQIYPRKGDIWALYRNWSPDWDKDTPDEVVYVYDMVEVLDDYNEERGVSVSPLIKAAGFRAVFYKNPDPKEVKLILKDEMFRFSHQVPSYVLTGEEKSNAPKGFAELDPAATPLELLKVIEHANREQVTEIDSNEPET